jgi:hypothetical protein
LENLRRKREREKGRKRVRERKGFSGGMRNRCYSDEAI